MIHDLTRQAGFALCLDADTFEITTGSGILFDRQARNLADMKHVLYRPDALPLILPYIGHISCSTPARFSLHFKICA